MLSHNEIVEVAVATSAYNATIAQLVNQKGLAFVDAYSLMEQIANGGIQFDEFTMKSDLVFGLTFSLDGVHPTQRGNAFIANEILKAM